MMKRLISLSFLGAFGVAFLAAPSGASASLLSNGGFETPDASGGDVQNAPGAPWIGFNQPTLRFTTASVSRTGSQSLKMFGPFDFIGGGVGAVQAVPATPGGIYVGEIWGRNDSTDPIQGNNFAVYKLEFLDAGFNFVGGSPVAGFNVFESNPLNASTPQNQWSLLGVGGQAPAGTAFVQAVIVHVQLGDGAGGVLGGAVFFDDASVTLIPEPATLGLLATGVLLLVRRRR